MLTLRDIKTDKVIQSPDYWTCRTGVRPDYTDYTVQLSVQHFEYLTRFAVT